MLVLTRIVLFTAFAAVFCLGAAAGVQDAQTQNSPFFAHALTAEDVARLQAELAANPDDLDARRQLLAYYQQHRQQEEYVEQMRWVIQNHPESPLAASPSTPGDYSLLKPDWDQALTNHADSPQVLFNAGVFFSTLDVERALQLFQRARELDEPSKAALYVGQMAAIYAEAVMIDLRAGSQPIMPQIRVTPPPKLTPDMAIALRNQIQDSNDPALLSATGLSLARMNMPPLPEQKQAALQLIQRAVDLDPTNPRWKADLDRATAPPIPMPPQVPPGYVSIGAKVAEANLINKVEPVYPPLALGARVQGDVEFTAYIGANGRVESLSLVRGHPLLVTAAREAVLQWSYRPTLLNGQPVSVVTDIVVPFRLSQ